MRVETSAENLKAALKKSAEEADGDRFANIELAISDLRVLCQRIVSKLEQQDIDLADIKNSTAGLVNVWQTTTHTWKLFKAFSHLAQWGAKTILALTIFWAAFTHATSENINKAMELFK